MIELTVLICGGMVIVPILGTITAFFVAIANVVTEWGDERRAKAKKKKASKKSAKSTKSTTRENSGWELIIHGK